MDVFYGVLIGIVIGSVTTYLYAQRVITAAKADLKAAESRLKATL